MRYFTFVFHTKPLKPSVCFTFTAHVSLDQPPRKCPVWLMMTILDGAGLGTQGLLPSLNPQSNILVVSSFCLALTTSNFIRFICLPTTQLWSSSFSDSTPEYLSAKMSGVMENSIYASDQIFHISGCLHKVQKIRQNSCIR